MQTKKVRDNTRTFLSAQHELHKDTFRQLTQCLQLHFLSKLGLNA